MISEKRILKRLVKPRTANEVIDLIFKMDWNSGSFEGWKHYVHLNKMFSPMHKKGLIDLVGTKVGPSNRTEKIWIRK